MLVYVFILIYPVVSYYAGIATMSLQRNPIIGYPALKWLLVIVLVFAPLQGVMSALGHDCHADPAMMVAEVSGSDTSARADINIAKIKCLCDHCDDKVVCDNVCNAAHIGAFLTGFAPSGLIEPRLLPQTQVSDQLFSYVVSPLLHPPQS